MSRRGGRYDKDVDYGGRDELEAMRWAPKARTRQTRLWEDPDEFGRMIDAYPEHRAAMGKPMTWTGLALYLGFSSTGALRTYAKDPEYAEHLARGRAMVEDAYECNLHGGTSRGSQFALSAMADWVEKKSLDNISSDGSMKTRPTTVNVVPLSEKDD